MGRLRAKEAAKREEFLKHAKGYMPRPVLGGMGLLGQPPHCQISVPTSEAGLLSVTLEDIQNVPISAEVLPVVPGACQIAKLGQIMDWKWWGTLDCVQAEQFWACFSGGIAISVSSCRHLMRAEAV